MISTTTDCDQSATVSSLDRDVIDQRLRPGHVLVVSIWCGFVCGLLEVGVIVLRKQAFDLNQFYWMSRHFVWLIPLTNLLILITVGAVSAAAVWLCPYRGRWPVARLLCVLTLLPPFWAASPRLYGVAGLILVIGVAARLVPFVERHREAFAQWVKVSFPLLAAATLLLAAWVWATDQLGEWREQRRPLPAPGSPNVLLIVLDTVAAGHMSLYGYDRPTTTTLGALAQRGVRYDRAQATSSWTLPSHGSLFTGRWPHDLSAGWLTPLDRVHPTLAEYLGSRGYATAGFVANTIYCGADSGLARGFTHYRDYVFDELGAFNLAALIHRPLEGLRSIERFLTSHTDLHLFVAVLRKFDADFRIPAAKVSGEFLDWLSRRRQPERPFFAFVNYYDAHYPYQVPEGGIRRFGRTPRTDREPDMIESRPTMPEDSFSAAEIARARDSYDNCIADLDEQLGRLLDELERFGVLDRTWLVITSDHGESFGEQAGVFRHGTSLYQPQLHVPLLFVPPAGSTAGQAVSERVSLRDVPSTIVDVLSLANGSPFLGKSLARFWNRPSSVAVAALPVPEPALSEVVPTDVLDADPTEMLASRRAWASLADGNIVYIHHEGTDPDELYDLRTDPREIHDLAADPATRPELERMRNMLDKLTAGPLTRDRFRP